MQKTVKLIVYVVVLCSFLVAGFFVPKPVDKSWPDPTATALTGAGGFSVTLLKPESLAGAYIGAAGFPLPVGFKEGEKQFGGEALQISNAGAGSQQVCFALPTYQYGWRGAIYQWDQGAWMKLNSVVMLGDDGTPTRYCGTVYGDGIYSLLIGYDPSLAPEKKKQVELVD